MSKQSLFYIWLCTLAALVWPVSISAQATQPEAREINTEARQEEDGFVLRSLFTILDSNNFPVLNNEVQIQGPGQIQLIGQQSAPVEAAIEPANTPIKIALVIDASGSMQQEIGDVKAAAQKFVDKAPNNAEIAVFSFARRLEQKQDFTPKAQANVIKNAIVSIQNLAPGTDNTCIYDAAFGAINSLNNAQNTSPQERRAVVLFTDGIDNERRDPAVACSDIKEPNVISQANEINQNRIPVQVHTMGLCVPTGTNECPNVERDRLINLSKETFAYSKIGKIDELDTMFDTILAGLNSQWMATTKVKAIKGRNTAALRFSVKVRDAEPQTVGFDTSFDSPVDQTSPAPTLKMSNPTFDADANVYNVQIDVTNFNSVSNVTLEVVSDGGSVNKEVFSTISPTMPITVKADTFTAGKEYAFELSAIDRDGTAITNDKGETVIERRIIKHDPKPQEQLSFAIKDADIDWADKALNIQLDNLRGTQGKSLLYSGQINDESRLVTEIGPDVLQGTSIMVPLSEQELKLVEDARGQKEYTINLTLREEGSDQPVSLPQPYKDKPTVPEQLSLLQRVGQTLRNPTVLGSILVIVLLVSAMSIYLVTRTKEQNVLPPPVHNPSGNTVSLAAPPNKSRSSRQPPADKVVASIAPATVVGQSGEATVLGDSGEATIFLPQTILRIRVVKTPDPLDHKEQDITSFPCIIGRHQADFTIAGDKSLSRKHAEVRLEGDTLVLTDCNSVNGTYVNGVKLKSGESIQLAKTSKVRLGSNTELELDPII